jgi:hypothetical protein
MFVTPLDFQQKLWQLPCDVVILILEPVWTLPTALKELAS